MYNSNTRIKTPPFCVFQDKVGNTWELREVSLIHQKVLVIAEVAWEPRVTRGVYLVTWEVDGGGLKGNLFTDSTCVTLSLWPDTIYHIQVWRPVKHRNTFVFCQLQMFVLSTNSDVRNN